MVGRARRLCMHSHDARRARPAMDSHEVGDLVDGSIARLLLGGESLRKFAAVTFATGFEVEQVVHANATVTSNAIERDLTAIKQLVEVGPAHPQTLRCLIRSDNLVVIDDSDLGALTHATSDMKQDGAQLNADSLGISVQSGELLSRNVRGFDGLHANRPQMS